MASQFKREQLRLGATAKHRTISISANTNITTSDSVLGTTTIPASAGGTYIGFVTVSLTGQSNDVQERLVHVKIKRNGTLLASGKAFLLNVTASFPEFLTVAIVLPPTTFTGGDVITVEASAAANSIFKTDPETTASNAFLIDAGSMSAL